jgi:hypothetical protein
MRQITIKNEDPRKAVFVYQVSADGILSEPTPLHALASVTLTQAHGEHYMVAEELIGQFQPPKEPMTATEVTERKKPKKK